MTPVAVGKATITVTATYGKVKKTAKVVVTVEAADPKKPTALTLNTTTRKMRARSTFELIPALKPSTAEAEYEWTTSNEKVATVVDGMLTAMAEGNATITCTATYTDVNGEKTVKTASAEITVADPKKPTAVTLNVSEQAIEVGDTFELIPTLSPATAEAVYTWATSNERAATVAEGMVTPIAEGTATITCTATYTDANGDETVKTASAVFTVTDPKKPTGMTLNASELTMYPGAEQELYPVLTPETAEAEYVWSTSSEDIMTVEDGLATAIAEGVATITCTATYTDANGDETVKTASAELTVVDPKTTMSVALNVTEETLYLGNTLELIPTLTPSSVGVECTWTTSSADVATVADGVVTAVAPGTATITCSANYTDANGDETVKTADAVITVSDDYIYFGTYPQTGDTESTPILWRTLEKREDGTYLLISEYGLDAKPYNTKYTSVTWETCTLRAWLNGDFLNSAFTEEEKAKLVTVTNSNPDHPSYSTEGGNDTQDTVWLLSIDEVNKYFATNDAYDYIYACYSTQTAKNNGAFTYKNMCMWWLRSPGDDSGYAAIVYLFKLRSEGLNVDYTGCVRPVVELRLS